MSAPSSDGHDLERLATYVTARTGLSFPEHRRPELERGLRRLRRELGGPLEDVLSLLDRDARRWAGLLDEITVGETYFFREPEHFALVRCTVLPSLWAARGHAPRVRAWSAGCASGEEAYSLAIVLHEQGLLAAGSRVLGTDLNPRAIERARRGRYRSWSLRNLDPKSLAPHFEVEGGEYQVVETLRQAVDFRVLNLAELQFPSPVSGTDGVDLIFCRNVFIYLDAASVRAIGERFAAALAPGGYLVLGPSDPLLSDVGLESITTPSGVIYRRPLATAERPAPVEPRRLPDPLPVEERPLRRGLPADHVASAALRTVRRGRRPAVQRAKAVAPAWTHEEVTEAAVRLRELANRAGAAEAEVACRRALERAPLAVELHYLHALLLVELGRREQAVSALRRTLYLDRELAIAHFTLGTLLAGTGDRRGARRAFENAAELASLRPSDEALSFSDGVSAAGLALAARRELGLLGVESRSRR